MSAGPAGATTAEIRIPAGDAVLAGDLVVPENASGIVLFAHGSGSSRRSSGNRWSRRRSTRQGSERCSWIC